MREFAITEADAILRRTPGVLQSLLADLPDVWLHESDGPGRWTPAEVLVHLVEAERELWVTRMDTILRGPSGATFAPFERDANLDRARTSPVADLLAEFSTLRSGSLHALRSREITASDLVRTGIHPEFGPVTLAQLLSTWTTHDLAHLTQITRTMARQYTDAVGPWRAYLRVLAPTAA
jgi:hypothetical protein